MNIPLLLFFIVLLCGLHTGCDTGSSAIEVDTSPVGTGLAVIGIGLVIAAWIGACFGGNDD